MISFRKDCLLQNNAIWTRICVSCKSLRTHEEESLEFRFLELGAETLGLITDEAGGCTITEKGGCKVTGLAAIRMLNHVTFRHPYSRHGLGSFLDRVLK